MVNVDDRLSNLPQDILHYILSFLEIRDVIQLSRFSRRWRRVWKSMPYLNFDQTPSESKDRFIGFAWSVLSLRDGFDIKRFRFSCHGIRKHVLKSLLSVVKNRGVVVLDLDIISFQSFENGKAFELLSCFAVCRPLPEINLTLVDSGISYLDSMSLAMVRTLHLENSELCGQTFGETQKLVLRCPRLENLLLKNCYMRRRPFDVIEIEAANLKNLKFLNTAHKRSFRGELKVSAPNLLCLSYRGPTLKGYSLQNLSSLNKALIHFTNRVKYEENGCLLLSLVSALYNAEVLYLSSRFLQVYYNQFCILICFCQRYILICFCQKYISLLTYVHAQFYFMYSMDVGRKVESHNPSIRVLMFLFYTFLFCIYSSIFNIIYIITNI